MDSYGREDATSPSPSDANKTPDQNADKSSDQKGTDSEGKSGEPGGKKDAEARIQQLVSKIKDLEGKLDRVGSQQPTQPVPGQKQQLTPELQRAKDQIKTLGYVDEEVLEKRIRQMEDRILLDTEHSRLESSLTGDDGRPKYERKEVEEFMRKKAIYDPETAYEKLYKEELLDWNIKQADKRKKSAPPKSDSGQAKGAEQKGDTQTITRDVIREKMSTPEWKSFYDKNREKILSLMQKGQLS
jgi:hypothetical protein